MLSLSKTLFGSPIAAIDVGSNALRAVIARPRGAAIEVLKEVREPLRLGEDVFFTGQISAEKCRQMEEVFIRLLHLFAAYGVRDVRAVATSAMRDAANGKILSENIARYTGIELETIKGREEAQVIYQAVRAELALKKKTTVLMDIGGGSTEVSVVIQGELVASHSFNIGTVRLLALTDPEEMEIRIHLATQKMLQFVQAHLGRRKVELLIGTGGNLRRIGKIRRKVMKRPGKECTLAEVARMSEIFQSMSLVERIRRLELDGNRADVILPATLLVRAFMRGLGTKKILLPYVGLKEGIILSMLGTGPRKFRRPSP